MKTNPNKEVPRPKKKSTDPEDVATIATDSCRGERRHEDGSVHCATNAEIQGMERVHRNAPVDQLRVKALVDIDYVPSTRVCRIVVTEDRVDRFLMKLDRLLQANFRVRLAALEGAQEEVREALQP